MRHILTTFYLDGNTPLLHFTPTKEAYSTVQTMHSRWNNPV